jgi:hypothetical protein
MRLEVGDEARHRRDGDAQTLSRAREAAGLDDTGEGSQRVEAVHRVGDYCCTFRDSILTEIVFIP